MFLLSRLWKVTVPAIVVFMMVFGMTGISFAFLGFSKYTPPDEKKDESHWLEIFKNPPAEELRINRELQRKFLTPADPMGIRRPPRFSGQLQPGTEPPKIKVSCWAVSMPDFLFSHHQLKNGWIIVPDIKRASGKIIKDSVEPTVFSSSNGQPGINREIGHTGTVATCETTIITVKPGMMARLLTDESMMAFTKSATGHLMGSVVTFAGTNAVLNDVKSLPVVIDRIPVTGGSGQMISSCSLEGFEMTVSADLNEDGSIQIRDGEFILYSTIKEEPAEQKSDKKNDTKDKKEGQDLSVVEKRQTFRVANIDIPNSMTMALAIPINKPEASRDQQRYSRSAPVTNQPGTFYLLINCRVMQ